MGETTFVKNRTSAGYRSQDKLETTPGKFKTDPKLARVRENASDFATAAHGGKLIRNSISSLVKDAKDKTCTSRMLKALMAVVKSDAVSPAGTGNLVDGNTKLLVGFDYNAGATRNLVFPTPITDNIDRVTGQLTINIPAFVPLQDVHAPNGTTHFQFVSAGS